MKSISTDSASSSARRPRESDETPARRRRVGSPTQSSQHVDGLQPRSASTTIATTEIRGRLSPQAALSGTVGGNLQALPTDTLESIFGHLGPRDLAAVHLTSRHLSRTSHRMMATTRSETLGELSTEQAVEIIRNAGRDALSMVVGMLPDLRDQGLSTEQVVGNLLGSPDVLRAVFHDPCSPSESYIPCLNVSGIVRLTALYGEQAANQLRQDNAPLRTALDWAQSYARVSNLYTNPLTARQFLSVARSVLAKDAVRTLKLYLPPLHQRDPLSLQQMANTNEFTDGLVESVLRQVQARNGESSAGPTT